MLAWVMNLGFAASSAGTPPASAVGQTYLTIGIWIGIRCLALALFLALR